MQSTAHQPLTPPNQGNLPEARIVPSRPPTSVVPFFPWVVGCQKENGSWQVPALPPRSSLCCPGRGGEAPRKSLGSRMLPLSLIPWFNNETVQVQEKHLLKGDNFIFPWSSLSAPTKTCQLLGPKFYFNKIYPITIPLYYKKVFVCLLHVKHCVRSSKGFRDSTALELCSFYKVFIRILHFLLFIFPFD